jgi:hypothetical protein
MALIDKESDSKERAELLVEIAEAFADVRLGAGVSLIQARNRDAHWGDDPSERISGPDLAWPEISDEKMRHFSDVFNFLDPEGFRFYVPAFMGWVLRHAADGLDWSFCFAVCGMESDSEPWSQPFEITERLQILTGDQKRAIYHFIEFELTDDWALEICPECVEFWKTRALS